ncbi:MAG: hypothetical protein J0H40_04010 [Rhizobiales bacterium]|nr:hypothetical protein [Hyphomicrobiales bacterium]
MADEEALTYEGYLEEARAYRAFFFLADYESDATAVFNYGRDRVALAHSFLGPYARGTTKDGDPLANAWAARGFRTLGDRISWAITPQALVFSLASGHKFQLRRQTLRAWMDHDEGCTFPELEEV